MVRVFQILCTRWRPYRTDSTVRLPGSDIKKTRGAYIAFLSERKALSIVYNITLHAIETITEELLFAS